MSGDFMVIHGERVPLVDQPPIPDGLAKAAEETLADRFLRASSTFKCMASEATVSEYRMMVVQNWRALKTFFPLGMRSSSCGFNPAKGG